MNCDFSIKLATYFVNCTEKLLMHNSSCITDFPCDEQTGSPGAARTDPMPNENDRMIKISFAPHGGISRGEDDQPISQKLSMSSIKIKKNRLVSSVPTNIPKKQPVQRQKQSLNHRRRPCDRVCPYYAMRSWLDNLMYRRAREKAKKGR